MCVCAYVWETVSVCTCVNAGVHKGHKGLDTPEQGWQAVVSCPMLVLGTEFGYSIRAMACFTTGHLLASIK